MTEDRYYKWNREDDKTMYIDAVENAVDSLETSISYFDRSDNLKWKWIVFALHHSLYMFCTVNLEGGNYQEVVTNGYNDDDNIYFKRGNDKWKKSKVNKRPNSNGYTISWEEIDGEPQVKAKNIKSIRRKEKLISFWTALARVQDGEMWMAKYEYSKPVKLTEMQWKSIEWIAEYVRNRLTHFIPMGLSISVISLKKACLDIVNIIEQLAFETDRLLFLDEGMNDRVAKSITLLKSKLQ